MMDNVLKDKGEGASCLPIEAAATAMAARFVSDPPRTRIGNSKKGDFKR